MLIAKIVSGGQTGVDRGTLEAAVDALPVRAFDAAGRDAAAMRLMLSHGARSWLGMMDFGSSLTTEAWNVSAKPNLDLNHAWGAVPLNVISRHVLGVTPLEPGFANKCVLKAFGETTYLCMFSVDEIAYLW